jgi:hypothetical protein
MKITLRNKGSFGCIMGVEEGGSVPPGAVRRENRPVSKGCATLGPGRDRIMTTVITACPKPRRAGVAIGLKPERVAQLIRDVISRDQLTPGRLTEVIYDADALDPGLIRKPIPSMTRGRNGSRRTRGFADAV